MVENINPHHIEVGGVIRGAHSLGGPDNILYIKGNAKLIPSENQRSEPYTFFSPNEISTSDVLIHSSITLKDNVEKLDSKEAWDLTKSIEPVKFLYKNDNMRKENIGFIAEEVSDIFFNSSHKAIRFIEIISAMTKVIQGQQKEIEDLKKIIKTKE